MKTLAFMVGATAGIAATTTLIHAMRPDVTRKMFRDGKRLVYRWKKSIGIM